ncbi:hypothetical protein ABPG72_012915 [Tetrahymena utriculariae]
MMNLYKIVFFSCLFIISSAINNQRDFRVSTHLSGSIFENYYCGDIDGFPHFKLNYHSHCFYGANRTMDREFWNDGTSPSTFFYLYNYLDMLNLEIPQHFQEDILKLTQDWNLKRMRDILLWDKLKLDDPYGVGIDDRLWYAISFIQIQNIIDRQNKTTQNFFDLANEIFDWVGKAFENNVCGGGVFWDCDKNYKNAITNHLFIDLGTYLFEYTSDIKYIQKVRKIADWEIGVSEMLDKKDNLFIDGIYNSKNCSNKTYDKWTYNQGVYMKGYLALSDFYNDPKYKEVVFKSVETITQNKNQFHHNRLQFIPYLSDQHFVILKEYENRDQGETRATFKGIYMRYLGSVYLYSLKDSSQESQQIKQYIEKYVTDNFNYVFPLADKKDSYPFLWNHQTPKLFQTFTAGTTTTVLDLFTLYDFIVAVNKNQQKNNIQQQ